MAERDAPQSASTEEKALIGAVPASPRAAVFLPHAGLAALRRLPDWTAGASDAPPERFGGSMHRAGERRSIHRSRSP